VSEPSLHVLYQLAEALDIDHSHLTTLASFNAAAERPDSERAFRPRLTYGRIEEVLSEDEARELVRYLDWYRRRSATQPTGWGPDFDQS
jgi:hypothetical protein